MKIHRSEKHYNHNTFHLHLTQLKIIIMRTLKNIGLVLLGIILLLVIISLFLPSKVHVERTAVISGKPEMSFALVNDLHNSPNLKWFGEIHPMPYAAQPAKSEDKSLEV